MEKTTKIRIKELRDFIEQGGYFTNFYFKEVLKLFAENDKEKEEFIEYWIKISESQVRFLICHNYYTIASNKRGMWALLVYYYIPHIACLISIFSREFNIPSCLKNTNFMLPYPESNKILRPTERLRKALKEIEKMVKKNSLLETNKLSALFQYFHGFDKTVIPSYKTKQTILNELRSIKQCEINLDEINYLFHATIISGNVYEKLISYFGDESTALELVEYFKKCLSTFDMLATVDFDPILMFDDFLASHLELYQYEFLLTKSKQANPFGIESNTPNSTYSEYKDIKKCRDEHRTYIYSVFDAFLRTTTHINFNLLEKIETEKCDIGMFRCRLPIEMEATDHDHEDIISLLSELDDIFSTPEDRLNEDEINEIFFNIRHHKFYSAYEHEYFYYLGLSKLGGNDLTEAINLLKLTLQKCSKITAGETQVNAAKLLIILKLLTNDRISYPHLNSEINMIINADRERDVCLIDCEDAKKIENNQNQSSQKKTNKYEKETKYPKYLSKRIYLAMISTEIRRFNVASYCRFEGVEPYIYNPFKKLESLVADIYALYENQDNSSESPESRIRHIILQLMSVRGARYPINKNIITLHQYTAKDIFSGITFREIAEFCTIGNFNSPNIIKLRDDSKLFGLLSEAINPPASSRS
ncbi:hypothetical protein A1359_07390 [Methylomonas lenta]|uniref:Uncharacterized protein n=2 Tax=Methylomonas lenta TaxID=980561 RepID=A0A177NEI1_9GAMM|nr:hypothetical protein A1359_07390 [Methylomonas lenta]